MTLPDVSENRRMGRPKLTGDWKMFTTKLPGEVRTMLEEYADAHGVPIMDVLCRAIEAYTKGKRKTVKPWPRVFTRSGKG